MLEPVPQLFDLGPVASSTHPRVMLPMHLVAAAFDVAPSTIGRWPLPTRVQRGRETLVDLREVVQYRLGELGGLDLTAERARLARVQAERQELALARERGALLEAGDVQAVWEQYIAHCRARLLALPDTAAPRVVSLDVRGAADILRELVYEALTELARYNPDHADDPSASTQPDHLDPEPQTRVRQRRRKRRLVESDGTPSTTGEAP